MSDNPKTEIDPSLTWNVKLGFGILHELLHDIASADSADSHLSQLSLEALWIAENLKRDIEAAHENADEAASAAPYLAKIRTAATDTELVDHVLRTFRLADADFGDDNPGVRVSVLKAALDAWITRRQTSIAA
jgi:hypothetical protein